MKKLFLFSVMSLLVLSCSGNDDSDSNGGGADNASHITGTWVIYKAIYDGQTQPINYEYIGICGREVLQFHTDKTVSETIYTNSNCENGASTEWDWWAISNSSFRIGYENSEAGRTITVSGDEAIIDSMEEWGYKKYYKKVN